MHRALKEKDDSLWFFDFAWDFLTLAEGREGWGLEEQPKRGTQFCYVSFHPHTGRLIHREIERERDSRRPELKILGSASLSLSLFLFSLLLHVHVRSILCAVSKRQKQAQRFMPPFTPYCLASLCKFMRMNVFTSSSTYLTGYLWKPLSLFHPVMPKKKKKGLMKLVAW